MQLDLARSEYFLIVGAAQKNVLLWTRGWSSSQMKSAWAVASVTTAHGTGMNLVVLHITRCSSDLCSYFCLLGCCAEAMSNWLVQILPASEIQTRKFHNQMGSQMLIKYTRVKQVVLYTSSLSYGFRSAGYRNLHVCSGTESRVCYWIRQLEI
jgi:hypothetical protein